MHWMRQLGLSLVLTGALTAYAAPPARTPQQQLSTITSARQAHDLPAEEAVRAHPVHLHVVATYFDPYIDPRHGALFVCDTTGCVFVMFPSLPILPISPGNLLDIVGVSFQGDYAPIVNATEIKVVGRSHVPERAEKPSMAQMLSGSVDCRWVEIEGLVHQVRLQPRNIGIDFATLGGPISGIMPREEGADYESLVDSMVRVHANVAPVFNRKRQMVGVHLFIPSMKEISVLKAAPPDPYAVPALSINHLLSASPGIVLPHRVRVQGRITLHWPGRTLCIQQGNDGLCMQTAQATTARLGDLVDVIGFPSIADYKPTLENAAFRKAEGAPATLPAKAITPTDAFRGENDGELVQMEGELVGQDWASGNLALMLRSGKLLYSATLPMTPAISQKTWKEGSILRLTGICSVQIDPASTNMREGAVRSGGVQILLRSLGDIEVVREPSWWTPGHALGMVLVIAAIALAFLAWGVVLRHRVHQQTKALRSSEERLRHLSQHDALTNLPNRILLNDRLEVALHRAERFGEGLALIMVDVDRFKEVNDALGHLAGDKLLCEVADRIRNSVRKTDTVARIGGDEFIVLLPDLTSPEEAGKIAAKIVAAGYAPFESSQSHVSITFSVGVCTYPDGGSTTEQLMQNVDAAMYGAKARGKNQFQVYMAEEDSNQSNEAVSTFGRTL